MWVWGRGGLKQCEGVVVRLKGDKVWFVDGTIIAAFRNCVGTVAERV